MAGKSLGTLTIDLVAKVGGFVSGMDKAERASAKWSKQVQDDVAKSSAALAGIGAAAIAAGLAVGASGFQLLKSTSREGANKQVISSQADSLIKISRIWADF
ncbi:hypothetical protein, partial [Klebsiella pneumoniae]|uniref:hypothetical protein n=1 Tax=Klebsiella pneumoniae TaxID=573 RepID=UPI001F5B2319